MSGSTTRGDVRFGQIELRAGTRQLMIDGELARLGARAFDLLLALVERRDRVVDKNELLEVVWPGLVVEENNLQVQVSALRKLLGPTVIATIPGRGYRFTAILDGGDAAPVAVPESPAIPNNLPQQRTRFIGRDAALSDCARLLPQVRLLTLIGVGGCGKTRLALELAQRQLADYADGVWFVDLAPLQEPQRVAVAVATALAVGEETGTPLIARLTAKLATRRTLLVLDNCEHVIDAVAEVADALLAACADLTIVTTSREGLGVAGEQVYPVPPLSLAVSADEAGGSEAVRLFVDRAGLTLPDFALDRHNATVIGEICRRLDGIALAIELAAARVKMLSVEEIRARLDDRFRFLTGGSRALPRHQTLQATLQWSHDSLSPAEQQLFRQLAVFAGGCTLAAAAQVAETSDEYAVLERLTHLHDKSLLVVERDGAAQPRYRMLETVRQYAQDRLNEAGDGDAIRERHLRCFVALAEEAQQRIHGPQEGAWMARLRLEQENLLVAHTHCEHASGGAEAGLRLVASLWRYWRFSAQSNLGYRLAGAALARAADAGVDELLRCRALWSTGTMAIDMGRYDEVLDYAQQSLACARAVDNPEEIATGLSLLATGLHDTGQLEQALPQYEAALEVARTLGPCFRLSDVLCGLGEIHRDLGHHAAAEACYEESIAVARELRHASAIALPLSNLAGLSIVRGKLPRARAALLDCLEISSTARLHGLVSHLLDMGASLAAALGEPVSAARFSGAALAQRNEEGRQREPVDDAFIAPLLARAQLESGASTYAAAEAAGRVLGHDAAMAELKRWLERAP